MGFIEKGSLKVGVYYKLPHHTYNVNVVVYGLDYLEWRSNRFTLPIKGF